MFYLLSRVLSLMRCFTLSAVLAKKRQSASTRRRRSVPLVIYASRPIASAEPSRGSKRSLHSQQQRAAQSSGWSRGLNSSASVSDEPARRSLELLPPAAGSLWLSRPAAAAYGTSHSADACRHKLQRVESIGLQQWNTGSSGVRYPPPPMQPQPIIPINRKPPPQWSHLKAAMPPPTSVHRCYTGV